MGIKSWKSTILMLLLAVSFLGVGGCGRSGNDPVTTMTLAFDTDKDGVPDIFDDHPGHAGLYAFTTCNEADYLTVHDSIETAIGKHAPFAAPSTFRGTIDAANSPDYFAIFLESGKKYSLVFYDPEKTGGRAVTFDPDVKVYSGSGQPLALELSVAGNAQIIVLSFSPQETRTHYIALRDAHDLNPGVSYRYCFDLVEDSGKKGMHVRFKAPDGSGYTYTHQDMLFLRQRLTPYVKERTAEGQPKTFDAGAQDAFAAAVNHLGMLRTVPVCAATTVLDPYVSDIPWNPDFGYGFGMDATTGFPSNQVQAVATFTPPVPAFDSTSTLTQIYFINSDDNYSSEIEIGSNSKYSSLGNTFQASASYARNIKYSETETTLIVKYYLKEIDYRKFNPGDGPYALTGDAKAYLTQNGPDSFRNQYGDYFIAGARYGAQYVAAIHIKATSSEELQKTSAAINAAIPVFSNTETFKAKFSAATKNCSVDFVRTTQGGNPAVLSAAVTVDQVFDDLNKFVGSVTIANRAPLEAYMYRYNQIHDGLNIPAAVNINSCVFYKIRDLSNDYLALSSHARVIAGLDPAKFQAGIQADYAQQYRDLTNDINDNRREICGDLNKITVYAQRVLDAKNRFSDLIDRFSFYQKLVAARNKFPSSKSGSNIESGFDGYNLSVTVNNDIQQAYWTSSYKEDWQVGHRTWSPSWAPGAGYRVCYIKTQSWSTDDAWTDKHHPSLGNDRLSFYFESGYDRGGDWKVSAKGVHLGANYPFMW